MPLRAGVRGAGFPSLWEATCHCPRTAASLLRATTSYLPPRWNGARWPMADVLSAITVSHVSVIARFSGRSKIHTPHYTPQRDVAYQLPMTKSNIPGGMPCNGAAFGAARGRPCVLSSIAQAADTRADSLVPFWAMSANASIATATCPSSNPDSAARIAAVSAFCDPAGRPAPGRRPPCFMD